MKDWVVPIVVAVLTGGLGGAVVPLIAALRGRGKDRVDAVAALTEASRRMVADFEEDAKEARAELRQVRAEAHYLAEELRSLRLAILHPAASIDGLRELVRSGHGENGSGTVNLSRP